MKHFINIVKIIFVIILMLVLGFVGFNYHSDHSIELVKQKYEYPDSKYINVNGVELHYRNKGAGPSILLIHGNGASLHTWESWMDMIPDTVRTLAVDLPGYGLSGSFSNGDFSDDNYVKTLAAFLEAIEVDSVIVAGNSFGGLLAWRLAHDYPERVSKITLLDASGYPSDPNKPRPIAFKLASTPIIKDIMSKVTPRSLFETSLKDAIADDSLVDKAYIDRHFELFLKEGNRKAFAMKNGMPYIDKSHKIKTIQQPTLILWGDKDTFVPVEDAYKFERDLKDCKLIIYEGIGHIPMEEIPERSFNDFWSFIIN